MSPIKILIFGNKKYGGKSFWGRRTKRYYCSEHAKNAPGSVISGGWSYYMLFASFLIISSTYYFLEKVIELFKIEQSYNIHKKFSELISPVISSA